MILCFFRRKCHTTKIDAGYKTHNSTENRRFTLFQRNKKKKQEKVLRKTNDRSGEFAPLSPLIGENLWDHRFPNEKLRSDFSKGRTYDHFFRATQHLYTIAHFFAFLLYSIASISLSLSYDAKVVCLSLSRCHWQRPEEARKQEQKPFLLSRMDAHFLWLARSWQKYVNPRICIFMSILNCNEGKIFPRRATPITVRFPPYHAGV